MWKITVSPHWQALRAVPEVAFVFCSWQHDEVMAQDTREFDRYRLARALGDLACELERAAGRIGGVSDEERRHLGATRCALIRVADLIRAGVVPREWLTEVLACAVRQGRGMLDPQIVADTEALLDLVAPPHRQHYAS